MKEEFLVYLKSIGITSAVSLERVEEILEFVVANGLMKQVDDILVEDHVPDDGIRVYTSLNLYSADRMFTAIDFLNADEFRVARTEEPLRGLEISGESYDFKKATVRSSLIVEAYAPGNVMMAKARATRENCEQLQRIALKYFLPNVQPR